MAIDPKLLVIKPVNELESVTGLQAGELLFYDGSDNLKKIDIDTFNNLSKTAKPLKPTDATPTEEGLYMPTESGTYANAGGLIAQEGYYTLFFFDGTNWTKSETLLPSGAIVIDGFNSNSTAESGSAKNDKLLHDSIDELNFNVSSTTVTPIIPLTTETIGSPTNYTSVNGLVTFEKGSAEYGGKPITFSDNQIWFDYLNASSWTIFGKHSNGGFLAMQIYTGGTAIDVRIFYPDATFSNLLITFNLTTAFDWAKQTSFKYNSDNIQIYQEDVLVGTLTPTNTYH